MGQPPIEADTCDTWKRKKSSLVQERLIRSESRRNSLNLHPKEFPSSNVHLHGLLQPVVSSRSASSAFCTSSKSSSYCLVGQVIALVDYSPA